MQQRMQQYGSKPKIYNQYKKAEASQRYISSCSLLQTTSFLKQHEIQNKLQVKRRGENNVSLEKHTRFLELLHQRLLFKCLCRIDHLLEKLFKAAHTSNYAPLIKHSANNYKSKWWYTLKNVGALNNILEARAGTPVGHDIH